MQKNMKILAIVGLIASLSMISGGFAYADNSTAPTGGQTTTITLGLNAGAAAAAGGIGALSGVVLTIVTAWNQNMTSSGTSKISPREFGILVGLGFLVGIGLQSLGISVETNSAVTSGVVMVVATLANYGALHITNMTLRPLFNHWFTGQGIPKVSGSKTTANTDAQT